MLVLLLHGYKGAFLVRSSHPLVRGGEGVAGSSGSAVSLGSGERSKGVSMAAPSDVHFLDFCTDVSTAEAHVEIRFIDERKGKGLFAKKALNKGDLIFSERPVVCAQFSWNALYKYRETAQENAQRLMNIANDEGLAHRVENVELPHADLCRTQPHEHDICPDCQTEFCSAECRQAAEMQYHRVLCLGASRNDPASPLVKLEEAWRNMHYPPESSSIMLLAKIIATIKQAKDKDLWLSLLSQFCSRTMNKDQEIAHKLLGDTFQANLELLRKLMLEVLYEEAVGKWFTPEGFRSLFALIGTNGQGIGTSALGAWGRACDECVLPPSERANLDKFIVQLYDSLHQNAGGFLDCEGSGLYVLQSCCNHSCVPNAEVCFPHCSSTLHVVATEEIGLGEEIFLSYLDCCQQQWSRHSRQKYLRENYLFECACLKCLAQEGDPDVTSDEEEDEECEAVGLSSPLPTA
uniref:histone-lysine N-trimethyltransferase SMYD5 isoform X2 n=1 Tax=Myxine glutinosa TaxID=7769 RepID=UPI00358F9C9F